MVIVSSCLSWNRLFGQKPSSRYLCSCVERKTSQSWGQQNQNAATFGGGGDCLEVINPPPQPQPTTVTSRANIQQRPAGVADSPANTAHFLVLHSCVTFLCYPLVCVQSVFHVWCSCPMGGCWRSVTRRMAIGRRLVRPPSPSPTVGQRLWRGWCWDARPISGNTNVRIVSKLCWPCVH